jgi:hypothetical protein
LLLTKSNHKQLRFFWYQDILCLLASAVFSSTGLYTPLFALPDRAHREGLDPGRISGLGPGRNGGLCPGRISGLDPGRNCGLDPGRNSGRVQV